MKNRFHKITKILVSIYPEIVAIYAHGSRVTGHTHKGSDLDLALLFRADSSPDAEMIHRHLGRVIDVAECPVDIGILSHNNSIYAKEVITNGIRIYCSNTGQCEEFEMYCLSYYAQLNSERSEILAAYQVDKEDG